MFEYDELAAWAVTVLDRHDFKDTMDILKAAGKRDPYDIMDALSKYYKGEIEEALNVLSLDEFMEYTTVRYRSRWEEDITYRLV